MKKTVLALLLLTGFVNLSAQPREISFYNIFDGTFTTSSIANVNWMNDGEFYTSLGNTVKGTELRKHSILTGEMEVLVRSSDLNRQFPGSGPIERYQFSQDEQKVLVQTNFEQIWRRSSKATYYIFDRQTGSFQKLSENFLKQQYAELSPKGDRVAFVWENNIYWRDLESGREKAITRDGEHNKIINGAADWVYEEEFGFAKAWYWSPDGQKIAFYRFDETDVNEFYITRWGNLYPEKVEFKYPKAGEKNSEVQIGIYHISNGKTVWVDINSAYEYIPRINWTQDPEKLAIRIMNRHQNDQKLLLADAKSGSTELVLREERDTWIDVHDDLYFLENGREFLYTSDKDGYNHIYKYDKEGNELIQITAGEWEVTDIAGIDEDNGTLYYSSTEVSPIERHLYKVGLDGRNKIKLSEKPGWNSMNLSPDNRFYIHTHSSSYTPPTYSLRRADGSEIRILEENQGARQRLENYLIPEPEFMKLDLDSAGTLNAMMIKPADFDPEKKYPMLVYVYGGPGSQTVTDSYRMDHRQLWHYFLATHNYVIVSIDGRGTGGRGSEFKKQVYKQLGELETADQIEAATYISENFSFVDENRIGIWGWSYGGYMSSLALAKGSDVFKAAIAVAPVTDWRYYDTIYTERYMQTPAENEKGYNNNAPVNLAGNINGKYLLIHGTADDNVHYQHAADMTNALIRNNIQFDSMIYPNRNHGISGGSTRLHLYRLMTDFIFENL